MQLDWLEALVLLGWPDGGLAQPAGWLRCVYDVLKSARRRYIRLELSHIGSQKSTPGTTAMTCHPRPRPPAYSAAAAGAKARTLVHAAVRPPLTLLIRHPLPAGVALHHGDAGCRPGGARRHRQGSGERGQEVEASRQMDPGQQMQVPRRAQQLSGPEGRVLLAVAHRARPPPAVH